MKLTQMKPKAQLILGVTLSGSLAVLGFAIPGASAHPAKPAKATAVKVHLRKISTLGKVLVNGKSHTIYMFGKDTSKKSHCGSTCKIYWPPVISKKKPIAEAGLSKKHLSRIAKTDQVTYYGHPLYTYLVDTKAGKDKGEGISDFGARWYVVSAKGKAVKPKKATTPVGGGGSTPTPTPTATHSAAPPYIPAAPTAIAGVTTGTVGSATLLQNAADTHTLYYLTGDVHVNGTFSCTNACQQIWIPLMTTGAPTAAGSASGAALGTITRTDDNNEVQVTYNGYPVYEYVTDTSSTTAKGNNVPGVGPGSYWYDIPVV